MHQLKSFLRNFSHNRLYTSINIVGLGIGLAAFTFIMLFILDELSYDKFNTDYKRIFRLESDITISGKQQHVAKSSFAIGPAFYREMPEVEDFVRFRLVENCFIAAGTKKFYEDDLYFCDSSVFNIFSYRFIHGNPGTALGEPGCIVMTESMAVRYFGSTDVENRIVSVKNRYPCRVTAVIQDIPENTHLRFSGLISMPTIQQELGEAMYNDLSTIHFWAIRLFTYVKLREGTSIEKMHSFFPVIHEKYIAGISERLNGVFKLRTARLDRIHLRNTAEWDLPKGSIKTIYSLTAIAIFILLIAAINYMNLATARSAARAREVGMRKVLGADRPGLARFFLADAILLAFLALALCIVIVELMLPLYNQVIDRSLSFDPSVDANIYLLLFITTLLIGTLSGIYPAYYLASFQPHGILSKKRILGPADGTLRKLLIVFQFSITTAIIAGAIIINVQIGFIRDRNLGFDKNNLLVIRATDSTFKKNIRVFKERVSMNPGVLGITTSNTLPGLGNYLDVFTVEGKDGMEKSLMSLMFVDREFISVLGMNVIQGRDFNIDNRTDLNEAAIINLTAARKLGWLNNALGKRIYRPGYERDNFKVIGVVDDLVYASLYEPIGPIVFFLESSPEDLICLRVSAREPEKTIAGIQLAWNELNPNEPFKYDYLDNLLDEIYTSEFTLNKVIVSFALLALFISLLGLFGLTSYITEKSSKNIGIRKLLGAGVSGIVLQFSGTFMKLILLSLFIATPVTWLALDFWLDHFAYRVDLRFTWFVIAWIIVLGVSQLTVITQTVRAARTNPADVIRYE